MCVTEGFVPGAVPLGLSSSVKLLDLFLSSSGVGWVGPWGVWSPFVGRVGVQNDT